MPRFEKDDVYVKPVANREAVSKEPVKKADAPAPSKAGKAYVPMLTREKAPVVVAPPDPIKTWKQAETPVMPLERPAGLYPPQTTGPANSPQGVLRDKVAQGYSYSDEARKVMADTPISYGTGFGEDPMAPTSYFGAFYPGDKHIDIKTWDYPPTGRAVQGTLAHELTHRWQDQYIPGWNAPATQQGFLSDVNAITPINPDFQDVLTTWDQTKASGRYDNALQTNADEMSARLAAYPGPQGMPPDFRNKYYPGMYANVPMPQQPPFNNEMQFTQYPMGLPPVGTYRR